MGDPQCPAQRQRARACHRPARHGKAGRPAAHRDARHRAGRAARPRADIGPECRRIARAQRPPSEGRGRHARQRGQRPARYLLGRQRLAQPLDRADPMPMTLDRIRPAGMQRQPDALLPRREVDRRATGRGCQRLAHQPPLAVQRADPRLPLIGVGHADDRIGKARARAHRSRKFPIARQCPAQHQRPRPHVVADLSHQVRHLPSRDRHRRLPTDKEAPPPKGRGRLWGQAPQGKRAYDAANFISLIASELATPPPIRLTA